MFLLSLFLTLLFEPISEVKNSVPKLYVNFIDPLGALLGNVLNPFKFAAFFGYLGVFEGACSLRGFKSVF